MYERSYPPQTRAPLSLQLGVSELVRYESSLVRLHKKSRSSKGPMSSHKKCPLGYVPLADTATSRSCRRSTNDIIMSHHELRDMTKGNTDETAEQSAAQRRTPSTINSDHSSDTAAAAAEDEKTEIFSKQAPPSPKRKTTTAGRAGRVGHKPETRKEGKKNLEYEDHAGTQRKPECPLSSMATSDGHDNERDCGVGEAAGGDPSLPPAMISENNPSGTEPLPPSASAVGVEVPSQSDRDAHKQEKVSRPMPSSPSSGSAQGVDLPGGMQLDGLLELLRSGPRAAFDAIAGVVSPTGHGDESSPGGRLAGRGSPADICSRWWDAAYGAGDTDAATVAVEALSMQLGLIQDDIFTTADEQRATILVAFLRSSPHPLMVRRVLLANPTAALSALRLAITVRPLQRGKSPSPSSLVSAGGEPARVVDATLRIESFKPLEGLDSLVELLQSPAGSVALSTVLGLEAKQEYAHGADLEAHSCLGPLLAALPCALSLKEHTRVSADTMEETLAGTSIALPPERVPVAHRLAKMVAELREPRAGLHRSGLMHKFEAYLKQVSRNRYAFVDLTQVALVKAMTTKGLAKEVKSDVCAWLTKAIYLHESLPRLCDEHAPELLGEPGPGITSASSAFLMSLSALLLRLGSWKFANTDNEILDSIDPSYLEFGSVRFESGVTSASDAVADDESEDGDNGDGHDNRQQGRKIEENEGADKVVVEDELTAAASRAEDGGGIEEVKGESIPAAGSHGGGDTVTVTAAVADAASRCKEAVGNDESLNAPLIGQSHEQQSPLAATSVPAGVSEEAEKDGSIAFSFATELFFLTHRVLEVIVSSMRRRESEAHRALDRISVSTTGVSITDYSAEEAGGDAGVNPTHFTFKEANDALYYGWAVEGLGSDAVLGVAVQFANFTARWLERHIRHRDDLSQSRDISYSSPPIDDNAVETPTARDGTLVTVPHVFITTMCDTWISASRRGRKEQFFSQREANNAASFCGRLMERVDLRFSVPTQAKLVDVLEEFIQTGERALELAKKGRRLRGRRNNGFGEGEGFDEVRKSRSGGFQGSMYWGAGRGFAGAIMDDETLRRVLPRQLMVLHASVSSVEGLAAEDYLGFFKFEVRRRIGHILLKLWSHPLREPRQAMLALFRGAMQGALTASTDTATSASAVDPAVLNCTTPTAFNFVASDFVNGVFDVLMYFMEDARDRLRDGVIEERSNNGRELIVGHPHWSKYDRERQQCKNRVSDMVLPNLQLLQTLCIEQEVLDLLRVGKLGLRSAAIISLILQTLYGEEAAEYAVVDPPSWGIEKPKLGGLACQLLAGLAGPGIKKTKAFASVLKSIDADFDSRLLEATATAPGCECLRGAVITRLALALELEGERMKVRDAEVAMSGVGRRGDGGGSMSADDPFEGVPEDIDADELVKAYGEALGDLVHTQVESLSPGHNYDRRREGATLNTPRKVASELSRKLPKMLPKPPHPDSSIFAILEEDALNFARFVITGPVGTPYEGGLFVFDVFLPQTYPADPPLVSMITTGQGTVKFNPNLYSDGKVCLSLLGKETGASVAGSDKWDPEKSSLWQVFASIQTQVMTEDPYYNQGGGRSHMRGRGTDETERASSDENARITLETIRQAAVANLRNPPRGCEEVIRTHFRTMRNRILRRCKAACERAPNERIGKAMLKASMELRVELDRLEEKPK